MNKPLKLSGSGVLSIGRSLTIASILAIEKGASRCVKSIGYQAVQLKEHGLKLKFTRSFFKRVPENGCLVLMISSKRSIQSLQSGNVIASEFLHGNRVEELRVFISKFDPTNCGPLFPTLF
jgi:phosphoenolpyruvate carboxylase